MASAEAGHTDLPVDLLEEILLRLDDVADLARCSAACSSFHHIIADDRFLRRFRSLHRTPILGFLVLNHYHDDKGFSFHPANPPCRFTPAARALAGAADFSFSTVPKPINGYDCNICDVRDGRVLLSHHGTTCFTFKYLVVYDPLRRCHVKIPPIPGDLMPSTGLVDWGEKPFLVPAAAGDEKGGNDSPFQVVMCNVLSIDPDHNFRSFVYSSITGKWRAGAPCNIASYEPPGWFFLRRYYAHGSFYWVDCLGSTNMLVFDMSDMKFSVVDLLPGSEHQNITIAEVGRDRVGLLILGENTLDLYSKAEQDIGIVGAKNWRHDHMVRLRGDYQWSFAAAATCGGVAEGYALLEGYPRDEYKVWKCRPKKKKPPSAHYFTVELETLLVEQLCVSEFNVDPAFLYASFPPPFAPPRI
ncbi:unnamed protein product [Urochloa decumbens]|uniref:F-box domain-containing protein n=1 Tax=Urochloa decumbens TaxID=240449 RepID=A0ABC8VHS5_9POAL